MEQFVIIRTLFESPNAKDNLWFFRANLSWDIVNFRISRSNLTWYNGVWYNGIWENGLWVNGTWVKGVWENGVWKDGFWKNGVWKDGTWFDGVWKNGVWRGGTWEDGEIYNPKTEDYERSDKNPNECEWSLSYKKA